MLAQARAELPNECCGMLAGRPGEVVECHYPLRNAAASPEEYWSDDKEMFRADRDRQRRGLEFVGVYHSHPTSDPVPSRKDRERSYSPDVVNFIISLKDPEPVVRAWWLTDTEYREAAWELVEE
jgi:[CysO sulfur-carrier protein]-S-L-cysteine hydrolase